MGLFGAQEEDHANDRLTTQFIDPATDGLKALGRLSRQPSFAFPI